SSKLKAQSSKEIPSSKRQARSSKFQTPNTGIKHQTPNTKHQTNCQPPTAAKLNRWCVQLPLSFGIWCWGFLWCLVFGVCFAPLSHGAEISERSAALKSWLAAQTKIQTWSADFVQIRTLKALAQPLT